MLKEPVHAVESDVDVAGRPDDRRSSSALQTSTSRLAFACFHHHKHMHMHFIFSYLKSVPYIHLLETRCTARRSTQHGLASTVVYPLPCIRLDGALSAHLTPHEMGSACSRPPKQIPSSFAAVSALRPSTGHFGPRGCMQVMAKREERRYLARGQPDRRRQR